MDGKIKTAYEAILEGNKGIYFWGSSKNEGNRKSKALFGTRNTENQYDDFGEQGIKRFIYRGQGRRYYPHPYPEMASLIFTVCIS